MSFSSGAVSRSRALAALLIAWTGLALTAGVLTTGGDNHVLLPALASLVGVTGLWRPLPLTGVGVAVLATGLFAAVQLLAAGAVNAVSVAGSLFSLGTVGALADLVARQSGGEEERRHHDALLVEEMTATEGEGALKWAHASRLLADEIGRARRYRYPVSLAVLALDDWPGLLDMVGHEGARKMLDQAVTLALSAVRPTDRVAYRGDGELVLLLTHTTLEGALVAVEKLLETAAGELKHELRAGVAEFPTDAVTPDELVAEAGAALEFARSSDLKIASRQSLAADG